MFGDISMGGKRIKLLGDHESVTDAAQYLDVLAIGNVKMTNSIPIMTANTTGTWAASVTPAFDATNVYRMFDRNESTRWDMGSNTYTILIQTAGNSVPVDQLRIIKSGTMLNCRIRIGEGSVTTLVGDITSVDDEGILNFGSRYNMSQATVQFATSGGFISEMQFLSGVVDIGKELVCHETENPLSVASRSYVDNFVNGLTSYISASYATPAFTAPTTDGYISLASDQVSSNPGWYCLDRKSTTYWICTGVVGLQTIQISFPTAVLIATVQIQGRYDALEDNFDSWSIKGYDDTTDTWDILLSVATPPPQTLTTYQLVTPGVYQIYSFEGLCSTPKTSTGLTTLNYTFGSINCNGYRLARVAGGVDQTDAVNRAQLNNVQNSCLALTGGTMTGDIYFSSGNRGVVLTQVPTKYYYPLSQLQAFQESVANTVLTNIVPNQQSYIVVDVIPTATTDTDFSVAVNLKLPTGITGNVPLLKGSVDNILFELVGTDEIAVSGAATNSEIMINGFFITSNDGFDTDPTTVNTVALNIGSTVYTDQFYFPIGVNYHISRFFAKVPFTGTAFTIQLTIETSALAPTRGIEMFAGSFSATSVDNSVANLFALAQSSLDSTVASISVPTSSGPLPYPVAERLNLTISHSGTYVSWNSASRTLNLIATGNSKWFVLVELDIANNNAAPSDITLEAYTIDNLVVYSRVVTVNKRSSTPPSIAHTPATFSGVIVTTDSSVLYFRARASTSDISIGRGQCIIHKLASV